MSKQLVSDELWQVIEPLLPPEPPKPKGGRPRVPDRAALRGIIFVLRSGIPWEMLPPEMGCGSGITCWRRLRDWQEAGVWGRLHRVLLDRLGEANRIDWSRVSLDSASIPAKKGASRPGRIRRIKAMPRGRPHEAPCCGRPRGSPALGDIERRQQARLDAVRGAAGLDRADTPPERQTEEASGTSARRQGLRHPQMQAVAQGSWHQVPDSQEGS